MDPEGIFAIAAIFIGAPWIVLHYVTKWKQAPKITEEDERVLDEMYNLARRLEERLNTVERIVAADHPDWRPGLAAPAADPRLDRDRGNDWSGDRDGDRDRDRRSLLDDYPDQKVNYQPVRRNK